MPKAASPSAAPSGRTAALPASIPHAKRETLGALLDRVADKVDDEASPGVALGEVLHTVGRRAYGPLLLLIGLFSISPATIVPGMTWASASLTLIVAGQMALGRRRPWMPKAMLELQAPRALVLKGVERLRPWAKRIDAVLKPRLTFLAAPPFVNLLALTVMAAALITIPLALAPFLPLAPGLAIVLIGLGMTSRDGLVLGLGLSAAAAAAWLLFRVAPPF